MVCTKCKIDKPDADFYQYKGKNRSRCKICIRSSAVGRDRSKYNRTPRIFKDKSRIVLSIQKEVTPPQIVSNCEIDIHKDNPDYRKCKMCEQYKPVSEFYQNKQNGYYHARCKVCHNQYTCKRQHEYYQKRYETCGGSEKVLPKPNAYMDKYQEEQTHWVMKLMGWTYNDNGVWSKEGIKDKDNNWVKIPKEEKVIQVRKTRRTITSDDIKKIIEYRKSGLLLREIAVLYGCSKTKIGEILIYENAKKS